MSERKREVPKHRHLPSDIIETQDDLLLGVLRLTDDPSKVKIHSQRSFPDNFFTRPEGWDLFVEDFIPEVAQETVVASEHLTAVVIATEHETELVIASAHSTTTVIASTHSTQTVIASAHGQVTIVATDHSTSVVIATPHQTVTTIATAHGTSTQIQNSHTTVGELMKSWVDRSLRDSDTWSSSALDGTFTTKASGSNISHHADGLANHWYVRIEISREGGGPSKIEWRFQVAGTPHFSGGEDYFGTDINSRIRRYEIIIDGLTDPFSWDFQMRKFGNAINVAGSVWIYQVLKHVHGFSSQPAGHPVSTQPSGHSVDTQPSGHPVSTQPSGHPVSQQPSGHSVSTQPSGHTVQTQPSGHTVVTQPSGHIVTQQPSGHQVTNPPHGHPLTGE